MKDEQSLSANKTILVIAPGASFPPVMGSHVDLYGQIRFFIQEGWKVALCVCHSFCEDLRFEEKPPTLVESYFFPRRPRWSRQEDPRAIEGIQRLIDRFEPAIVLFHYTDFAWLAASLDFKGAKAWFRPINFELAHEWDKTLAAPPEIRNPLKTVPTLWKIFQTERKVFHLADRIFFISPTDEKWMTALYGNREGGHWVLPFVDPPAVPVKTGKKLLDVIYLANNYDSPTQISGARQLLFKIIPAVESALPGQFRFHFAGRGGRERIGPYSGETIMVHDFVPDISALLEEMDLACFPNEIGWGCKIKMITALASGLPVIGASRTFRGIPKQEGAYYSCDDIDDYVNAFRALAMHSHRQGISRTSYRIYQDWRHRAEAVLRRELHEAEKSNAGTKIPGLENVSAG